MEDYKVRFGEAPWLQKRVNIQVVGLGGIGSWAAFLLDRAFNGQISLHDFDTVDATNIGGQLYPPELVGYLKANALYKVMRFYNSTSNAVYTYTTREDKSTSPILVCCVDNMQTRSTLFNDWARAWQNGIFIDGRMTAETYEVYIVDSDEDIERYRATLFDDSEVDDEPCSFKATSHNGARIGSEITTVLTNWVTNEINEKIIRPIPFHIEWIGPLLMHNVTD